MTPRRLALLLGIAASLAAPRVRCEEEAPAGGLPYAINGDVSVGYRNVDIDGSKEKYREDYNLRSGFRLFDFSVDANAKQPDQTKLDRFHLEVDTPGDEPVSHFRLTAADRKLYDLRVDFTRSKYFYAVPQLWQEPVATDVRLDDLHDWNVLRWNGSVDLTVRAPHLPTLFFGYRLYERSGSSTSTVIIPGGDTFIVDAPVDSLTNVGRLGTEFTALGTDFFVQQEYRRVSRSFDQNGPQDPRGLDPDDASTMSEWLATQDEHIDIPATTVRIRRPIGESLDLAGAYFYSHADLTSDAFRFRDGTSNVASLGGVATTTDRASATLDTHVADLGGTWRISDTVRMHLTYRYNGRSEHGDLTQTGTSGFLPAGTSDLVTVNSTTGDVEWQPRKDLLLRGGMRYAWRDAYFSLQGEHVSTDTLGAVGEARYRPWSFIDLFTKYENAQIDDPLSVPGDPTSVPPLPSRAIQLTFVNRGQAGLRLRPLEWITLSYQFIADSRENSSFDASTHTYANAAGITLTPLPDLDVSLGYTRRDLDNRATILYAPLYAPARSIQDGNEDVVTSQLSYRFALFSQPWSTGWNVAYVNAHNTLAPRLEPGLSGFTLYDLDRIDGGCFLALHHRWLEPSIEFRMINYNERVLPENDYRATMLLFKIGRKFSLP